MMYVTGGQCGEAYGDLEDELLATVLGGNGVENGRQLLTVELDCKYASVWVFLRRLRRAVGDNGRGGSGACARRREEKVFSYRRRRHQ
jgi:hypothetical protein